MDIEVTNDTPTSDGSTLQTEVRLSLHASLVSEPFYQQFICDQYRHANSDTCLTAFA